MLSMASRCIRGSMRPVISANSRTKKITCTSHQHAAQCSCLLSGANASVLASFSHVDGCTDNCLSWLKQADPTRHPASFWLEKKANCQMLPCSKCCCHPWLTVIWHQNLPQAGRFKSKGPSCHFPTTGARMQARTPDLATRDLVLNSGELLEKVHLQNAF